MKKEAETKQVRLNSPCEKCEKSYRCTKGATCPIWREWFARKWNAIREDSARKYGIPKETEEANVNAEAAAAIFPA